VALNLNHPDSCPKDGVHPIDRVLSLRGRVRPPFSRNAQDLVSPEIVPGTAIYLDANKNAQGLMDLAAKLTDLFGYNQAALVMDTGD